MSSSLLKRELDLEIEEIDKKKQKVGGKAEEKKKARKKKTEKFKFNDKDYSKEDDYTEDSLKNLGKDLAFGNQGKVINMRLDLERHIYPCSYACGLCVPVHQQLFHNHHL